jgi:hypothetical protein
MENCAQIPASGTWPKSRQTLRSKDVSAPTIKAMCSTNTQLLRNDECRVSFPVFDELSERGEAWNAYQYMLKLSSAAVGKIVLGQDFHHFESVDSSLHRLPLAIAEVLVINKKISTMGEWYAHLPFGDPKKLQNLQHEIASTIIKSMEEAKAAGSEDLPLQDAALKAADVIGMDFYETTIVAFETDDLQTTSTAPSTRMESAYQSKISCQHSQSQPAPVSQQPPRSCHGCSTAL